MRFAIPMLVRCFLTLVVVWGLCMQPAPTRGRGPSMEQLRGAILVKALGYERGIAHGDGPLVIAVVMPGSGDAAARAVEIYEALSAASSGGVEGRPVRMVKVSDTPAEQIGPAVRRQGVDVVYVPEGLGALAERLSRDLSGHRGLIACGDSDRVGRGCMLSVEARGQGQRLVVDVTRAEQAGFTFDARLLRLSRVVR